MRYWTTGDIRRLQTLWPNTKPKDIAAMMGRSTKSVWAHAHRVGLLKTPSIKRRQPPASEWIRIATETAQERGIHPGLLLAGSRKRTIVLARWEAWRRTLASNDNYSIAGLGRISGHDHATIIRGLQIMGYR